jgi:hypothetical protein
MMTSVGLAYSFEGPTRQIYLPGPTTDGHRAIELACDRCHTQAFADRDSIQAACVECHGAELAEARDAHPQRKFTDPRNAQRVDALDARYCVTCHREHRPEITTTMGLSLPRDYCYRCHESIADERPSHRGLGFDTCADAGCHNFHDNRALYEDFLGAHLDEPWLAAEPLRAALAETKPSKRLTASDADAPSGRVLPSEELGRWVESGHARNDVNCTDCHADSANPARWVERPASASCGRCHEREQEGYRRGRHGMPEAVGLEPQRVGDARRPMKAEARERQLGCTSCHGSHGFDTRRAAVDACLGCHDDRHSKSYRASRHAELWFADPTGRSGASCATCHLPRVDVDGTTRIDHGQNDNLRPNEKMVRGVCLSCHGLGFTLDALADRALIDANFDGKPRTHVRSLEMVRARSRNPSTTKSN